MSTAVSPTTGEAKQEFIITRTFDAPRDLVWKAFTEADRLAQWWGPPGSVVLSAQLDLQPGGMFLYSVAYPGGGGPMWGKFVYGEILPTELLVFINSFSDEEGNTVRAPFSSTWPLEIINTLTLAEHDGKTTITMRGNLHNATDEEWATFNAARDSVRMGMGGTLDQLEQYLAKVA